MPETDHLTANLPPPDLRTYLPLLRGVSRSFYLSIRLLPGPLRAPMAVGYLLARATDTVADTTALPQDQRQALLAQLQQAIETPSANFGPLLQALGDFAAQQTDPHERALMRALPDCLPLLHSLPVPDQASVRWVLGPITRGQSLDIARFGQVGGTAALSTDAQLSDYTWLVAGCVGEFWTELCERHLPGFASLPTPEMRELGRQYGMGLQRLNILRDAGADLAQGRCYLPTERLSALGLSPTVLTHAAQNGDHTRLMQLAPLWAEYLTQTQNQLAAGLGYSRALTSRRMRLASALPALIGARTVALLTQAGPLALSAAACPTARIKMPRHEVRTLLWRLLLRGASANALAHEFDRLSAPPKA